MNALTLASPLSLSRRAAVLALPAIGLASEQARADASRNGAAGDVQRAEWLAFRDKFMMPEGRIIDTGNQNVSHTEGQGWALMSAVRADDRASFERILAWTNATLRRPQDELFAWRFRPGASTPVDDLNNAADGDLFIAWALLEAGERWGNREHTAQGVAIARDVLRLLIRQVGPFVVMLPGARGFERADHTVINPSYYAYPALRALARALPDPAWLRVAADGITLTRLGRFGRWGLPPDWLAVSRLDGALTLPTDWAPRFSYDAVRVPLYMAWVGMGQEPGLTGPAEFWTDPRHRHIPAWADLTTNFTSPYAASPGIVSVAALAMSQRAAAGQASFPPSAVVRPGRFPMPGNIIANMPNYYSGALSLLCTLAARDTTSFPGILPAGML
jgi:endoglucanase